MHTVFLRKHLTVTVLASISVNMNSPPSKSPFRYNSALKEEKYAFYRARDMNILLRQMLHKKCMTQSGTCSPCRCMLVVPSSTRGHRGPADSCLHGWDGSGHFCDLAALRT